MSLKRECDVCGAQQDADKAKMLSITLPAIPDTFPVQGRQLDTCYRCARAIHKAAERQPYVDEATPSIKTRAQQAGIP